MIDKRIEFDEAWNKEDNETVWLVGRTGGRII